MELEELKRYIILKSKITREQLEERIKDKIDELGGLVSGEGAIYIVAKEEGVDILSEPKISFKKLVMENTEGIINLNDKLTKLEQKIIKIKNII